MRIARSGAFVPPLLVLVVLSALPAIPLAAQGAPFGPLHFEDGAPLQRLSYTAMAEIADPVAKGHVQARLWMAYANIFDADSTAAYDLRLDLEHLLTIVDVRYGVADGLEAGVSATTATTGGGFLDGFLAAWHRLFHLGDGGRELYPENAYGERLIGPHGKVLLNIPRQTMALQDVRLFAKWRAWEGAGGRQVVSLRTAVRLPSDANRAQGERDDVALMALARRSWTRWHLHAMLGGSTTRMVGKLAPFVRSSGWFGMVALERTLAPWMSGVAQYSLATPRLHGFEDRAIDGPSGNLLFGVTGSAGRSWLWDVSFQEDMPPGSPATDFTLGASVTRRW